MKRKEQARRNFTSAACSLVPWWLGQELVYVVLVLGNREMVSKLDLVFSEVHLGGHGSACHSCMASFAEASEWNSPVQTLLFGTVKKEGHVLHVMGSSMDSQLYADKQRPPTRPLGQLPNDHLRTKDSSSFHAQKKAGESLEMVQHYKLSAFFSVHKYYTNCKPAMHWAIVVCPDLKSNEI